MDKYRDFDTIYDSVSFVERGFMVRDKGYYFKERITSELLSGWHFTPCVCCMHHLNRVHPGHGIPAREQSQLVTVISRGNRSRY